MEIYKRFIYLAQMLNYKKYLRTKWKMVYVCVLEMYLRKKCMLERV